MKDLCRKHVFSEESYYLCRSKFGGMELFDAKLMAETMLENEVAREALQNAESAPFRRDLARPTKPPDCRSARHSVSSAEARMRFATSLPQTAKVPYPSGPHRWLIGATVLE